MLPIARHSTRLATISGVRQSSTPQPRTLQPQRQFTTSTQRSAVPRTPPSPSESHSSLNGRKDAAEIRENVPVKNEQSPEVEEGNEDKPLADTRKSSSRWSTRRRRMNEVPKPPPIPNWFLDLNVALIEHTPGLHTGKGGRTRAIRCVDSETGHVLFTVPYQFGFYNWALLRHLMKHSLEKDPNDCRNIAEILFACQSQEDKQKIVALDAQVDKPPLFKEIFQTWGSWSSRILGSPVAGKESTPDNSNLQLDEGPEDHPLMGFDYKFVPSHESHTKPLEWYWDPLTWCFLEAETSVRAALSLADGDRQSSFFAADRVDLSLQCHDSKSHDKLNEFVDDLAAVVRADLIRLDANDFAELCDDYVGQGDDRPGTYSNLGHEVFDGYIASKLSFSAPGRRRADTKENNEMEEDDEDDEDQSDNSEHPWNRQLAVLDNLRINQRDILVDVVPDFGRLSRRVSRMASRSNDMNRDDARLDALLDGLLDAATEKRSSANGSNATQSNRHEIPASNEEFHTMSRYCRMYPVVWRSQTAWLMINHLHQMQIAKDMESPFKLILDTEPYDTDCAIDQGKRRQTIIHVRDLRDICSSPLGNSLIQRLVSVVRKRRRRGERIVLVGTTASDAPRPAKLSEDHPDEFPFRSLSVPPFFRHTSLKDRQDFHQNSPGLPLKTLDNPSYLRILDINLRHIQTMLRRARPDCIVELSSPKARKQLNLYGTHFLTERVLSIDEVQRLCLVAIGLSESYADAEKLCPLHIALAAAIIIRNDHVMKCWPAFQMRKLENESQQLETRLKELKSKANDKVGDVPREVRMEHLRKSCNNHETRLLTGVIDPQNIKTRFTDVHAPLETIEALKTLTSLSLLRPDAFKYGVLANDRLPGLLLYGPPGTGKTLLAKAVAKDAKATVLEVSGAQVNEKYVGEGEKMVRAVFTLAKKLSPCVVFIDEADSILASRSNPSSQRTHRENMNQFLQQWDGMDDHGVFMMVATNRPFDLDDAVLRRLPRRLLVDLPVAKDRESILGIHLKDEALDPSVSLSKLAEQTPLYSGSDLKNLAVAAALACVREENELSEFHKDDAEFKLPEKRVLTSRHFDKALVEISASISEDMSSLAAIRKFDEQYGERKGRRKKTSYGFGGLETAVDESAARVRQAQSPPP